MSTDLSDTVAPNSDQLDAIDLHMSGPRTFTVEKVTVTKAEQPVDITLAEFPRVWRPGKSMRRVLIKMWGPDGNQYVGRRLTLYCDDSVEFGGKRVGGVRISHMTDLKDNRAQSVVLPVTKLRSAEFIVLPLVEAPPPKPDLKQQVLARSKEIDAELTDDERKTWIRGELAALGGDTPENLTKLLKSWEGK